MNPGFELAVEFNIPEGLRLKLPDEKQGQPSFHHDRSFRYEVAIRAGDDGLCIASEGGFLKNQWAVDREKEASLEEELSLQEDPFDSTRSFPSTRPIPNSVLTNSGDYDRRCVFQKSVEGKDTFYVETVSRHDAFWREELSIAFGPRRSTLKNLPEAPEGFPVSTYAKRVLEAGVQKLFLDSRRLRQASSPNNRRMGFVPDGSNLPWAIQRLREMDHEKFKEWLDHVRTALREIKDIRVVEREDDRHAYLMLRYATGVEVPVLDGLRRHATAAGAHACRLPAGQRKDLLDGGTGKRNSPYGR